MSTKKLSNVPLKVFRKFLTSKGLKITKTSKGRGGHEKWTRASLERPITLQTHVDPVPTFIVKQVLRILEINRDDFFDVISNL